MSRKTLVVMAVIGAVVVAGVVFPRAMAQARQGTDHSGHMKQPGKVDVLTLEKIHAQHIPMVVTAIDEARKAVVSGNKEIALSELRKAREMLMVIHTSLATYVKPKFANDRCPIMGTPINPDKVTKNLIRVYKGERVAFCCAGCPAAWDKLTDAQKGAKLAKVKARPNM